MSWLKSSSIWRFGQQIVADYLELSFYKWVLPSPFFYMAGIIVRHVSVPINPTVLESQKIKMQVNLVFDAPDVNKVLSKAKSISMVRGYLNNQHRRKHRLWISLFGTITKYLSVKKERKQSGLNRVHDFMKRSSRHDHTRSRTRFR